LVLKGLEAIEDEVPKKKSLSIRLLETAFTNAFEFELGGAFAPLRMDDFFVIFCFPLNTRGV
jgi:hypothetical protein